MSRPLARSVHQGAVALPPGTTIEARVLVLVADVLGVDVERLSPEVSLVEDLAADSLDLAEIAVAVENVLGVTLPRRFLDRVRTCGELIDAAATLTRAGRTPDAKGTEDEIPVRARVTPAGVPTPWTVERVLVLTPYAVETLTADALGAGLGARLELTVGAEASEDTLDRLRRQFARLGERGVHLDVRGAVGGASPTSRHRSTTSSASVPASPPAGQLRPGNLPRAEGEPSC